MTPNLVLIASYPKSGNTWVRLFFENLVRREAGPVSINDISNGSYGFERRRLFDAEAPLPAADLLPNEIDKLLPDVYARMSIDADGPVFVKVHDRARKTSAGAWLFPPEHVRAVLYIARHPFDVAVSWAHHRNIPVARAVADLCNDDLVIAAAGSGLPLPLAERPGSWNSNIASWIDEPCYPVTPVRYEDLYSNPLAGFARLAAAAGIKMPHDEIARAVEATRFERLSSEEQLKGFRERPPSSPAFFRSGRPQSWEGALDDELRQLLARACAPGMLSLGYGANGVMTPDLPLVQSARSD